jgi:anoctamin-10
MDIILLKQELLSYYMTDEVRRLVTESLIPYFQKRSIRRNLNNKTLERSLTEEDREIIANIKTEIQLPKYEQFDDYLEIVINFGYITLFASAFPIAPLLTLAFHWMEMESDKWKIRNVY